MSALARPGVFAALLAAAALALHPAIGAARWLPGQPAVLAALLLLGVLGLAARAAGAGGRRLGAVVTAAGAVVLVGALGVDGLRGHHGALTLVAGQSWGTSTRGLPGPLARLAAARVRRRRRARVRRRRRARLLGRRRAGRADAPASVAFRGTRFARPRTTATGGASRLRVAASDGASTLVADVAPGAPGRAGDLTIALEQYFPDFALDERQQPFSRSDEPRNPAALLTIEKGGQTYRAFVLQSMPGVHRVEGLGRAFSLLEIEPERTAEIAVHREPAALAALLGALLLAVGLALSLRFRRAGRRGRSRRPGPRGRTGPRSRPAPGRPGRRPRLELGRRGRRWPGAARGRGRPPRGRPRRGPRREPAPHRAEAGGHGRGARPAGRAALGLAVLLSGAGLLLAAIRVAALPGKWTTPLAWRWPASRGRGRSRRVALRDPAGRPALGLPPRDPRASAGGPGRGGAGDRPCRLRRARRGHLRDPAAAAAAATALLGLSALETTRAPACAASPSSSRCSRCAVH